MVDTGADELAREVATIPGGGVAFARGASAEVVVEKMERRVSALGETRSKTSRVCWCSLGWKGLG